MPTLKDASNARSESKFVYFLHPKGTAKRTRRADELLQADIRSHAARTAHARAKAKHNKDDTTGDPPLLPLQTSKHRFQLRHELVPFNPKPACFDYAAHEEEMLVQDALHYAKTFFWVRLAPSSATTPHPEQLFYSHTQLSKNAFKGYMVAVTLGLDYFVADHPQHSGHEKMRTRYTGTLLKEIRNVINDLPMDRLDEIIATVLILSVTSQLAVRPRAQLPASPFRSPLAEAQLLEFWGALKFDRAHLNGMRRLVELKGGLDKMGSPDIAALVQIADLINASRTVSTPMFAYHDFFTQLDSQEIKQHHSTATLKAIKTAFLVVMPLTSDFSPLLAAVAAACKATEALDDYQRTEPATHAFSRLVSLRSRAQHLALTTNVIAYGKHHLQLTPDDIAIHDIVRLTLLIFNNAVLYPLPPSSGLASKLAQRLEDLLSTTRQSCPNIWVAHRLLILWSLVMGYISCLASAGGADACRPWFETQCAKLVVSIFGTTPMVDVLETCLSRYLWCETVLGAKFRESYAFLTQGNGR